MIKRLTYIIVLALLAVACDRMDENERLIYEKPQPAQRVVLLEDFTGQRCINCPKGAEVISELLKEYGDALVPVSIHGGRLGFKGNASNIGLATDLGDEYYYYWNLEYQPIALINRHEPVNYPEWAAAVKEEMAKPTTLSIHGNAALEENHIAISISLQSTDGTTSGNLQVWLTEDGITAMQLMPDGSTNRDYVHNHVLRTAVNGNWGESFSLPEGETRDFNYSIEADPAWNTEKLSIVAFAYNDQGVIEAAKIPVASTINPQP